MHRVWLLLAAFFLLLPAAGSAEETFISLCYHRIRDDGGPEAMSTDRFISHLNWLRANGYRPISIDDLLAARDGGRPLPAKAVLLTFDDGHVEFYSRVYPLLRLYNYPAVLAVVGQWMSEREQVSYGDQLLPRQEFLRWEQIREMVNSGLVEVASHSFDLHRAVVGNPQGNLQPALTTRIFDSRSGTYEEEAAYRQRLRSDLTAASDLLARETGRRPRVMAWPYGKYNRLALAIARDAAMPLTLTLEGGENRIADLNQIHRILVDEKLELADFVWMLRDLRNRDAHRVVQVDLDYIYDPDPARTEANLGLLLDRIKGLAVDTVYLQAFADPDGNGTAEALYFPNRHLPVRADLFNRVAWQLKTRADVRVFAWMPVLGFDLPGKDLVEQVQSGEKPRPDPRAYRRLSPFSAEVRKLIGEVYEDLAGHADFDGILFHDDAFLTDREDASPHALAWYRQAGLPSSLEEIVASPSLKGRWTELKTRALVQFTEELAERVRTFRPAVRTARNLYARTILDPESESWFAQNFPVFLEHYDQVALMAMPYLEGAGNPDKWLRYLAREVAKVPEGLQKTVFELQSVDWQQKPARPVPTGTLVRQIRLLQEEGAMHIGYYPDDFFGDHPQASQLRGAISLESFPFGHPR